MFWCTVVRTCVHNQFREDALETGVIQTLIPLPRNTESKAHSLYSCILKQEVLLYKTIFESVHLNHIMKNVHETFDFSWKSSPYIICTLFYFILFRVYPLRLYLLLKKTLIHKILGNFLLFGKYSCLKFDNKNQPQVCYHLKDVSF